MSASPVARIADEQLELAAPQGERRILGARRLEGLDGCQLAACVAQDRGHLHGGGERLFRVRPVALEPREVPGSSLPAASLESRGEAILHDLRARSEIRLALEVALSDRPAAAE